MKKSQLITYLWLSVGLLAAAPQYSLAQTHPDEEEEEQSVWWAGALYVESVLVDNALRTSDESRKIEEVQLEYGADIQAGIDRELIALSADYNFAQNEYSEDSQDSRFTRTGQSELVLGSDTTFYQLNVSHSTQRFLADPAGPAILANTDQRDVLAASPLLRLQPGSGNRIAVIGHYAQIGYKETDLNDSERTGFGVSWLRDMSPVHTLGVNYMENDITYDINSSGDYTYRRAALEFHSELRRLKYAIQVGANEVEPVNGQIVDGLYYDLNILHGSHRNTWTLTAQQMITDTSLGNANNPFFSKGITSDASSIVQDQLERTSFGFAWRSDFFCFRCDVTLRAGYEEEVYFNVVTENKTEYFAGVGLNYRLRPTANVEFFLDHGRKEFAPGGRSSDYSETSFVLALDIEPVFRHFNTRFWYELEYRQPEMGNDYAVNGVGLLLGYVF